MSPAKLGEGPARVGEGLKGFLINSGNAGDSSGYFVTCFEQLMHNHVLLDLVDSKYK